MPTKPIERAWFVGFADRLIRIRAAHPELAPRNTGGGNAPSALALALEEAAREERLTDRAARSRWRTMLIEHGDLVPEFMAASGVLAAAGRGPRALTPARLAEALAKTELTTAELADRMGAGVAETIAAVEAAQAEGYAIHLANGRWRLDRAPQPAFIGREPLVHEADPDGWHRFGVVSDNHLGSKYARLDVLERLYDLFAEAGVTRVYNAGNWIDGEASFNRHDLLVHGMDAQCRYLAAHYPRRPGITTYAVAGDDHEGWYAQREGVDIGKYAERVMREAGRDDWVDLGYMEAPVLLRHPASGKDAVLSVVHPGGGSAYAVSYSVQKIIESLDGGEKPAIGLYGHYHKLWAGNIRNVWVIQTGCTQDQTPFMRKRKLEAHVGGVLVEAHQDPATGAILRLKPELIRYFNRGFAAGRWSHAGAVEGLARSP